jgi:translation initiation factor 1
VDIGCLAILVKAKRLIFIAASNFTTFYNPSDELDVLDQEMSKINVKVQPRKKKKFWTLIEGLCFEDNELKTMLRIMKKTFACNGTIIKDPEHGIIVQLQGNMGQDVKDLLIVPLQAKVFFMILNIVFNSLSSKHRPSISVQNFFFFLG